MADDKREPIELPDGTVKDYNDLTDKELEWLMANQPGSKSPEQFEAQREKREQDGEVNRLFYQLRKLIEHNHRFTDQQMDLGVQMFFNRMEPPEVGMLRELSQSVLSRPLWQLFAGWYRQVQEQGMATGALFDPSWEAKAMLPGEVEKALCNHCQQEFTPSRIGQLYGSNACGAAAERAKNERERAEIEALRGRSVQPGA